MDRFSEKMITGDIDSAINYFKATMLIRWLLALAIITAYSLNSGWLIELMVIAVVLCLISPLSFFGAFIQKPLEYNTLKLEERQTLHAKEANEQFSKISRRINKQQ